MEDEDIIGSLVIRSFSWRSISIALIDMLISLSKTGVDNSRTSIDMLNKSEVGAVEVGASVMGALQDGLLENLVVACIGLLVSSKVGHGVVGSYVGFIVGSLLVGSLVISPRRSSSSRGISIAPIDMLITLS